MDKEVGKLLKAPKGGVSGEEARQKKVRERRKRTEKTTMTVPALLQRIRQIRPGTVIPKPAAREEFVVKGWGKRAGQEALVYFIPNHANSSKPYQKGVTLAEWAAAFDHMTDEGEMTREWFERNLTRCAGEGGCNFTTIGGIFCLLGVAIYRGPGVYRIK
jgi:hypothetical protein